MLDAAFPGEVLGNDLRRWGEFGRTVPPYGGRTRGLGGGCFFLETAKNTRLQKKRYEDGERN